MRDPVENIVQKACYAVLRPVIALLFAVGVRWQDYLCVSRGLFIAIARTSFSSSEASNLAPVIANLTGIPRAEIDREVDSLFDGFEEVAVAPLNEIRLLAGWHHDGDFTNTYGGPFALPMDGPVPSFRALVDRYGGGVDQRTLADSLIAGGSAIRNEKGQLVATRSYFIPENSDLAYLESCSANLQFHSNTLCQNVLSDHTRRRFEGIAISDRAAPDATEEFRRFLNRRAERFLEEIDSWLDEYNLHPNDLSTTPTLLGVGVYAIERNHQKGISS